MPKRTNKQPKNEVFNTIRIEDDWCCRQFIIEKVDKTYFDFAQFVLDNEIDYDNDDFDIITREYCLQSVNVRYGKIENADCTLMPAKELVDFGRCWIEKNRK